MHKTSIKHLRANHKNRMSSPLVTLHQLMTQEQEFNEHKLRRRKVIHHQDVNLHDPIWRQMIVEWSYQVIDYISADRELVYISMNLLDRFLAVHHACNSTQAENNSLQKKSRQYLTDKNAYETAVMAALLMTMKLQGVTSLSINDLVQTSSNSVTSADIIMVGEEIIESLAWNKQIPTAARFVNAIIQLLPDTVSETTTMTIFDSAIFQIELSIQDESFSHEPPSLVAWMAFENAISTTSVAFCIRANIRSLIAYEMGHVYNAGLCRKLQKFQCHCHASANNLPAAIPPDDDDCCGGLDETIMNNDLSLKARPLTIDRKVVSVENLSRMPLNGSIGKESR